eukprot:s2927_g1.t1
MRHERFRSELGKAPCWMPSFTMKRSVRTLLGLCCAPVAVGFKVSVGSFSNLTADLELEDLPECQGTLLQKTVGSDEWQCDALSGDRSSEAEKKCENSFDTDATEVVYMQCEVKQRTTNRFNCLATTKCQKPTSPLVFSEFQCNKCMQNAEGSKAALPTTGPFTIYAEINPTAGGHPGVIGWGSSGDNFVSLRLIPWHGNGGIHLYWKANGQFVELAVQADGVISSGWKSIAASWDKSTIKIYMNGKLMGSKGDGVISSGWKSIAASWDKSTIKIYMNGKLMGSKGYSGAFNAVDKSGFCACVGEPGRSHEAFQGKMRHVQVLNRALADSAVKDLPMAHAASGVKEASLTPPLVFSHVNKFQCGKLGSKADLPTTGPFTIFAEINPSAGGHPGVIGWGSQGDNFVSLRLIPWRGNGGIHLYWKANGHQVELAVQADGVISSGWKSIAASWDKSTIKIYMNGKLMGSKGDGVISSGWKSIAASWDKSTIKIYMNGKLMGSKGYSGAFNAVDKSGFCACVGEPGRTHEAFNGEMRNVQIMDKALSETEVKGLPMADSGGSSAPQLKAPLVYKHASSFQCNKCMQNSEGSKADLPTTGPFTIFAEINPSAGGHPGVIGWGSQGDNFVSLRLIPWRGNGGIHLYWKANGQFVELAVQADGVIKSGWKSIAASWDKSTIKIYMNGKLMGSKGYSGAFNAVDKSGFCACVGEPGRTHEAFNGEMRNLEIMNKALSDSEEFHYETRVANQLDQFKVEQKGHWENRMMSVIRGNRVKGKVAALQAQQQAQLQERRLRLANKLSDEMKAWQREMVEREETPAQRMERMSAADPEILLRTCIQLKLNMLLKIMLFWSSWSLMTLMTLMQHDGANDRDDDEEEGEDYVDGDVDVDRQ